MSDELPPSPADDDASKAETIRITLPPKPDQPTTVKRETVRINLPGKPAPTAPPIGGAPKKETTKIVTAELDTAPAPSAPPPPPPSASKPFMPPPPRPPSQAGMPLPPAKPMSGVNPPPKPPALGARPTVPLKPAPAPSGAATRAPLPMGSGIQSAPVTMKAAAPKKETARITLPPDGGSKPPLPKATVKMQQTQPLVSRPAPTLTQSSAMTPAPAVSSSPAMQMEAAPDGMVNILAIIALVISLASLAIVFLAYQATSMS